MSFVKVDYTYACTGYCTTRWGPPSTEVIPGICERCAESKRKSKESNARRSKERYLKD